MSSRGTAIDRVLAFYRTASADTVRVTHQLAMEVMAARKIATGPVAVKVRKPRSTRATQAAAAGAASQSGGQ